MTHTVLVHACTFSYVAIQNFLLWLQSLEGPHYYQIADQGALLLAVPKESYPKTIKYSTDEGVCWSSIQFTEKNITFKGIIADPDNVGHTVSLWGVKDGEWVIHTLDFSKVVEETCE